jgi:long-chain fatty acid transport protein
MRCTGLILLFTIIMTVGARGAGAQTNEELFEQFQWNIATPGARANGMGGALVAVVGDASAARTNPAGLADIGRPQVSVDFRSADLRVPRLSAANSLLTGAVTTSSETTNRLPLVDAAIPLRGNRIVMALTRHEFLDYHSSFHLSPRALPGLAARGPSPVDGHVDFRAVSYGASVAVAVHKSLRLGLTVSVDRLRADAVNTRHDITIGPTPADLTETAIVTNQSRINGAGTSAGLIVGATYQPAPAVSLGLAFSRGPSFTLTEDFLPNTSRPNIRTGQPAEEGFSAPVSLHVPHQLTAGVALRPHRRLLLAVDAARIAYSDLEKGLTPIIAHDLVTARDFTISDATEVRVGGEFNVASRQNPILVRGGLFTNHDHSLRYVGDVQPHGEVTADQALRINVYERSVFNLGKHDTQITGTFGGGLAVGRHLQVDGAYVWKQQFVVSTGARF